VMTIPVWVLLGFAAWTLLTLFTTIGVYCWTRILTGRAAIAEWRADEVQGSEWYRRALRAHMNCVENLPVYTATVVVLLALRLDTPVLDALAITILAARICQTSVHLSFEQTNPMAAIRFAFFFVHAACMIATGVIAPSRPVHKSLSLLLWSPVTQCRTHSGVAASQADLPAAAPT
jgi:uncharacterized MAPEG superfamily protein